MRRLAFMKNPRFGVADISPYTLQGGRWKTPNLTWRFYTGSLSVSRLASTAFDEWQRYSGLQFQEIVIGKPNISISFQSLRHRCMENQNEPCGFDFDGPGAILGHSYFPNEHKTSVKIHLDIGEN